ncbi:MAG: hypothetical protein KKD18_00145 [Nanoarchaeota archaeon]|nr:hypothetical protein [Nanoarchaeota archaeon]MBU0976808.1 hypothetical protein [Nanoarchaeota archaeon]
MASLTQSVLDREASDILKEQTFKPEELFLLRYLKNANRNSSQQLQDVYELDISFLED